MTKKELLELLKGVDDDTTIIGVDEGVNPFRIDGGEPDDDYFLLHLTEL